MKLEAPDFLRSRLAYPVAIFGAGVSGNGVQALAASLGSKSQIYDDRAEEFTVEAARKHLTPAFPLLTIPSFVSRR